MKINRIKCIFQTKIFVPCQKNSSKNLSRVGVGLALLDGVPLFPK